MTYRNDLIRSAVVNRDLTKQAFAEQSGISMTVVDKVWNGNEKIELTSLIRVGEFLGIPLHKLFEPQEEAAAV